MLVLALVSIPLLLLEDLGRGAVAQAAVVANWGIWVAFAVDLGVRVCFARGRRMRYLARHWYDVGIVVLSIVPYFLPLRALRSARALRILRAARVIVFATRLWHDASGPFWEASFSGTRVSPCYFGFPGDQVWVIVDGIASNRITWPQARS